VTHDQVEAMTLGDRIAVLDRGRLQQVGTPDELYRHPRNVFVASFIGSPAMNLARATLEETAGGVTLVTGSCRAKLPEDWAARWPGLADLVGRGVIVGLRPTDFELVPTTPADPANVVITAVTVESLGDQKNVLFMAPFDQTGLAAMTGSNEAGQMWTAKLAPDAPVRFGDTIALRMDLDSAYFFDPTTQQAIQAVVASQPA
jgi:multiple sugar transport system ATP-binding protein